MIDPNLLPEGMTCRCGATPKWATYINDDDTGANWGLLFTCDEHKGCQNLPIGNMVLRPMAKEIHIKIGPIREVA